MGAASPRGALPAALRASSGGLGLRVPGGQAHSEPPGLQVMCPLSPDPRFYQEIRERGLNTSQESDDDLLDEPYSPQGTQKVAAPIVVKNYRPPQVTWSQLPEVGLG